MGLLEKSLYTIRIIALLITQVKRKTSFTHTSVGYVWLCTQAYVYVNIWLALYHQIIIYKRKYHSVVDIPLTLPTPFSITRLGRERMSTGSTWTRQVICPSDNLVNDTTCPPLQYDWPWSIVICSAINTCTMVTIEYYLLL